MTDYTAEIAALRTAIATGATQVSYEGKSVTYVDLRSMLARLSLLQLWQNGGTRKNASFVQFERD